MVQDWQEGDGAYLAPELLTSSPPTHAADIYSAGATVFECCTGQSRCSLSGNIVLSYRESLSLTSMI